MRSSLLKKINRLTSEKDLKRIKGDINKIISEVSSIQEEIFISENGNPWINEEKDDIYTMIYEAQDWLGITA